METGLNSWKAGAVVVSSDGRPHPRQGRAGMFWVLRQALLPGSFYMNGTIFSFLCLPRFRCNAATGNGFPWDGKIRLAPAEINFSQLA